ncbi:phage major capsid protein [Mycobacteroides abscessus]|uniref:phage major capsid protein n=1 Tax=Mycobacteroides abscessus TaxID=36809 RepID=UPI000451B7EF|nr:phage major capsid protein [Mycobacteroides abscessus]ETZ60870.1 phage major capsid protein, HK97 family [Mycobacteroides abscessus MAB_110811_2726]EUA84238.1 phage major capsid protein, HK97 family [Mycobacteroides abscessus]MDM1917148.1 phage major capsid protein [Mycobacteroides abscessus]MDM1926345.1 phage major capsid protein [Mycobacteroides abscessus]MDM1932354.1 phage major capsid protein [Mycobacteroides abscessus]
MAQLNELAPNTTDNHQGRLAYTPSELLPPTVVGPIFDQAQEHSLVLQLGEQIPVSYGETVIPTTTKRPAVGQVGTGTSNAQREGGTKPLSGTAWDTRAFSPIKLATIVTVSEEFAQKNPAGLYTQLQGDLAYAIGRGVDLAVLHGKDALRGTALQGIDTDNVIANTTNYKNLTAGNIMEGLLDGYDLVNADSKFNFDGWAVDPRFRSTLARASVFRDANGNIDPSRVNLNAGVTDILGLPAHFGRGVGGDLDAATDSGIRIIGGDFSQLRWGFADQIRVKISDTASLSDGSNTVSMWQTNQVAILVECTFGWVLGDKQGFVKFSNLGTTTYTLNFNGATGGTATVNLNGKDSGTIAYNAAASAVKSAIVAIDDGIAAADVTVTGSAGVYTVTVPGLLTANGASLTGGSPAATATVTVV